MGFQNRMMRRQSGAGWYSSVALSGGVSPAEMYALLLGVSPSFSEWRMALRRVGVQSMSLIVPHQTGRQKLMMRRQSGAGWYLSVAFLWGVSPTFSYSDLGYISPLPSAHLIAAWR